MVALRLAGAVLVLALLATPAASATAVEGTLRVEGPATLVAPLVLQGQDVSLLYETLPALTLTADAVDLERRSTVTTQTPRAVPIPLLGYESSERTEAQHGAATLRVVEPGPAFRLVLHVEEAMEAALHEDVVMRPVEGARLFQSEYAAHGDECLTRQPCHSVHGVHELVIPDLDAALVGSVTLYLYDATLVVRDADGETAYASGVQDDAEGVQVEQAFLGVRLEGAQLELSGAPTQLYAKQLSVSTSGLRLEGASGALVSGMRTYRAMHDEIETLGDLRVEPEAVSPGGYGAQGESTYAREFNARISGELDTINLASSIVYQERPAETAGIAAFIALLAGFVAYFWPLLQFHATALVAPLYTRLKPPHLLENDVRSAIYDIIRQNPGISARAVHRASGQSWGTVVYHLRQLESHHLVVSRRFGRSRNFYENHGKYRGMEQQLACLRSPRSRILARGILERPGLTQEELAVEVALAQPTTSYYVRKLVGSELVSEAREGRYVRYHPASELARFLELAEKDQAVPMDDAAAPPAQA